MFTWFHFNKILSIYFYRESIEFTDLKWFIGNGTQLK